jgi:hypothetical protein
LPHIHTRRNPQRIEDDIHRGAVGKIRHVLPGQNPGNHALVPVPSGHLVSYRQLSLNGQVDFDHLDHPGREFIPFFQLGYLPLEGPFDHGYFFLIIPYNPFQFFLKVLPFGHGQVFPFFDRKFG